MKKTERPQRPQTLTQVIIKTSVVTFCIVFSTFSYGLAVFGWIFPHAMISLSDAIGADNAAGMYCERIYNRDKTPENMYMVLDRYILARNHKKIVIFGSKFLELEESNKVNCEYCKIITRVNSYYESKAGNNNNNLLQWGNEDSRIKTAYAFALIKTGKLVKARESLEKWLVNTPDVKQPNHAYIVAYIIDNSIIEDRPATRQLLVDYVNKFESEAAKEEANVFALDFLWQAHMSLGNQSEGQEYARLLHELLYP